MRRLWLLVVLFLALISTPVAADVTVVAVPYVGGGVVNFTAVYITDTQVDLSWTKGDDIVNVMVRAKYGSMPMSRTEGYLVYEGALESVSDTSMNFDETLGIIYYRAWAENSTGIWNDSEVTTSGVEGITVLMLGLCALALVMTMGGYIKKIPALAMGAAGFWVILAFYAYNQQAAYTNGTQYIMYALFLISCGMAIVSALEPAIMREKVPEDLSISEASGDERPMFGYDMTRADYRQQRYMDSQPGMGIMQKQSEIERIREKSVIKLLNKNRGDRI